MNSRTPDGSGSPSSQGKSFRDIAKEMKCSVSTAHTLVAEALDHARGVMDESAEKLRQLELERVDELYDANYERAMAGSKDAAEICLKCIEKRSKLLGIDAPAKVEHSGSIDVATSAEEAKRKLAAILTGGDQA